MNAMAYPKRNALRRSGSMGLGPPVFVSAAPPGVIAPDFHGSNGFAHEQLCADFYARNINCRNAIRSNSID
jgi:hypothetical protein